MTLSKKLSAAAGCLFALLLLPCVGTAKQGETISDAPQDYSHRIALTVSGKQGVVGFRLPQDVYLHARSADLNDVRIFDAAGDKLAFAMQVPLLQSHVQRNVLPMKIFPVMSSQPRSAPGEAIDLDIRTGGDGTVLSVKTKSADKQTGTRLAGLVLDARQSEAGGETDNRPVIEALHFSLPPQMTSYSAQVWLEVSDDLKHWDTLGAAELSWLVEKSGDLGQTLANDRLEFEPRSFRYARLTWRSGEPLQFGSITAESVAHIDDVPVAEKLLLQPTEGKEAQDLVYKSSIAIPVEKIALQFNEENVVLPAALGGYRELPSRQIGQPNTWLFEPYTRATFYQITQAGQTRRSGELPVPLTHTGQWVLRRQSASQSKPALSISWQPANMVFLASGKGPYTLAFGRENAKPGALELSQVAPGFSLPELLKLEQAVAGPMQMSQADPAVQETAATAAANSARLRIWVLWGVLLLGVAVLGALAWSLVKQMKK